MTSSLPALPASPAATNGPASSPAGSAADLLGSTAPAETDFADLMSAQSGPVPPAPAAPGADTPTLAAALRATVVTEPAEAVAASAPVESADPAKPAGLTRDQLEQALAMANSLLQSFLPELTVPPLAVAPGAGGAGLPAGSVPVNPGANLALTTPAGTATATSAENAAATTTAAEFALAEDGALEIKVALPAASPSTDGTGAGDATASSLQAELELPGGAVVRLEANGEQPSPDAGSGTDPARMENFAGKNRRFAAAADSRQAGAERNFVFTGDKQVRTQSPETGITVAKTDSIMPAAPTEETSAPRNPEKIAGLPVRAEFQVAQTPAERITVPTSAPAGQTFATRAVETVTSLVDAQFDASMQRSGSVSLRLKFGGEDLSVRVELRAGAVHTDFRTDSPELRSALTREWQALAAQSPEQLRRYLDPVFSPAPASASGDQPFAQSGRQQQQQQAQSDGQQRSPRDLPAEVMSFTRRSLLGDTFAPEPASPRLPALLPTSLRLSALA